MMSKEFDAVIMGDGIAGFGVALGFAESGRKVLVIGRSDVKGGSTPAAAGILDPFLEMSPGSPLFALSRAAFRSLPSWLNSLSKKTGRDVGYLRTGMLYISLSKADEKILKKRYEWQRKSGIPVRWCGRQWILENISGVTPSVMSGLYYPSIGRIQPRKLIAAMRARARDLKVRYIKLRGECALVKGRAGYEVRAGKSKIYRAAFIINAAGSWASKVSWPFKPPVRPMRGQILISKIKSPAPKTILHSVDGGYIVPWSRGEYLLGSTVENAGFHPVTTPQGKKQIRKKTQRLLAGKSSFQIIDEWAGLRPYSEWNAPLIGPTRHPKLVLACGYYRSGILIGPYAGRLLAKSLLSCKTHPLLKPFSPSRNSK